MMEISVFALGLLACISLWLLVLVLFESRRQEKNASGDLIKRHLWANLLTGLFCLSLYALGRFKALTDTPYNLSSSRHSLLAYLSIAGLLILFISVLNRGLRSDPYKNFRAAIRLFLGKIAMILFYSVWATVLVLNLGYGKTFILTLLLLLLDSSYQMWGKSMLYRYQLRKSITVTPGFIDALLKKIAAPYTIKILWIGDETEDSSLNASAIPQGFNAGTLILSKACRILSEQSCISALLNHEVAHLTQRHSLKYEALKWFSTVLFIMLMMGLIDLSPDKTLSGMSLFFIFFIMISLGYFLSLPVYHGVRRFFEFEADRIACLEVGKEQYVKFLFFLQAHNQLSDSFPHYFEWIFATHPCFQKRVANIWQS